ncbi:MAG: DUF4914 domain-containing protein [Micrococcales bacterium 73-15]|nr:MAG: DUF4914 domain-containing protein [Micrococcales bacterium 73-15]
MSQLARVALPPEVRAAVEAAPSVVVPASREELYALALGPDGGPVFEVAYDVAAAGGATSTRIVEATVARCRNGIAVNYPEDYIRRRDPDCMRIADDLPTDKPRYRDREGGEFDPTRTETLDWLATQPLAVVPFKAGGRRHGYPSVAIVPQNAAFFALALVDLQGWVTFEELAEETSARGEETWAPRSLMVVAPPFRHTRFDGRQVVVHNRSETLHEVWAYNLYPGPSAKKGVFSVLLDIGEREAEPWYTAHASSVLVTTPYDNEIVIMHEGASGGGKSEMTQDLRRMDDGRILLGRNVNTGEPYIITLNESSSLRPVTDDMTLCHPALPHDEGKLAIADAEDGWFIRIDNLTSYGEDPKLEKICIQPAEPLVFFNVQGVPDATILPWEHTPDSTGKPCPNPRVVVPRRLIPRIIDEPEQVDVRTFGVRMPACTREKPTYGIMGIAHIVPPSLAWVWRLIAPRGDKNPSIGESAAEASTIRHGGLVAEGVGSYWPFSTGTKVGAANLLLRQIVSAPRTRYVLTPNQHIGAYQVGFAAEWLTREYLARRGVARLRRDRLAPARCPLFGYTLTDMVLDGQTIRPTLLRPEFQSQVGEAAYDEGARILSDFFAAELSQFLTDELDPLGRSIIEAVLRGASVEEYEELTPILG